jgi:hypothetical protein
VALVKLRQVRDEGFILGYEYHEIIEETISRNEFNLGIISFGYKGKK